MAVILLINQKKTKRMKVLIVKYAFQSLSKLEWQIGEVEYSYGLNDPETVG